jgi:hypothetical protein
MLLILYPPFLTSMEERERCYSFILSRTPHEKNYNQRITVSELIFESQNHFLQSIDPISERDRKTFKLPQSQHNLVSDL